MITNAPMLVHPTMSSSLKSITSALAAGGGGGGDNSVSTLLSAMATNNNPSSSKLAFPCSECNFEAQSARQLSRHKAVTHTQNALKCVLCPFVTAYQTNLLRHRKDVHGICGSKGNKSCKFCGFVSDDNDALIQHQIDYHQDILKSAQMKFAKELVSAGGDDTFEYDSDYLRQQDFSTAFSTKKAKKAAKMAKKKLQQHQQQQKFEIAAQLESLFSAAASQMNNDDQDNEKEDDDEDGEDESKDIDNFWKTCFMDNYEGGNQYGQNVKNFDAHHTNESSRSSTPNYLSMANTSGAGTPANDALLPATRIRRQYTCNDCSFRTVNPREFLYHRRDGHGHRIKIVECPYCVYACQYVQKLQRHLFLVHKLALTSELNGVGGTAREGSTAENVDADEGEAGQPSVSLAQPTKRKYTKRSHREAFSDDKQQQSINNQYQAEDGYDDEAEMEDNDIMPSFEMSFNEFEAGSVDDKAKESNPNNITLKCQICQIKFGDIASAQKHFNKKHKGQMEALRAESNDSSSSSTFPNNQKKVLDESLKVHVCNFCGYKTRWISELERHVRVHSKEKPFKCNFCDFKSKWKGDLNRHMQRYHPNQLSANALDEMADDGMTSSQYNGSGSGKMDDEDDDDDDEEDDIETNPADLLAANYECLMEVDDHTNYTASNSLVGDDDEDDDQRLDCIDASGQQQQQSASPSNTNQSSGLSKMYKCTYCDFMCNTASRFHVHYVQHLNTKPFQCSICGHRSNWEWDVTKHIKMKAQRDPAHAKATPVLIHDSGKRDYSKYNKFLVFVDSHVAEMVQNENSKIDFRGKRFKVDGELDEDDGAEDEGSLLQPMVSFEVDDDCFVRPGVAKMKTIVIKSVIASRHAASRNQMLSCGECSFRHKFARVIVAHLANHSMEKPYGCKHCTFDTNWREVIVSHCSQAHPSMDQDFDMRFRAVIDEHCVTRIISLDELHQLETSETTFDENIQFESLHSSFEPNIVLANQSNLIEPNLYEEKPVFHCEVCPFITTNQKKMNIHYRFHNPLKGTMKCKYCPYFVNNKEKLKRHQKLHSPSRQPLENGNMKLGLAEFNLQQLRSELNEASMMEDDGNNYYDDDGGTQSIDSSVLDVNEMKIAANVNSSDGMPVVKKFSYVCKECPAAFKSPGDFKTHIEFHSSQHKFVCNFCSYSAKTRQQLVKHMYVHTEEYIAKRVNSYPEGTKHTIGRQNSGPSMQQQQQQASLMFNGSKPNSAAEISFALSHYLSSKKPIVPPLSKASIKSFQKNNLGLNRAKMLKAGNGAIRKQRTKAEFPMKPVKVKLSSGGENGKQRIEFNNAFLMANQEFLETKEYLQRINSGIKNRCMYRCSKCPAVFTKVNTLIYHMTLHDDGSKPAKSSDEFRCESCDYSNASENNVSIHKLLHNLTESQTAVGYNFNYNCHKCPAGFSKRTRLEKHLSLHGAVYNWKCDKCDYSVPYAATLVKHRALHLINPDFQAMEGENKCLLDGAAAPSPQIVLANGKSSDGDAPANGGVDADDTINNNATDAVAAATGASLEKPSNNLKLKLHFSMAPPAVEDLIATSQESSDAALDESQEEEDEDFVASMLLIDDHEEEEEDEDEGLMEEEEEDPQAVVKMQVKPSLLQSIATNE